MINKVALKNFYENNKEKYYKRRTSGDVKQWNEEYKWVILPKLNAELAQFENITKDNITDFMIMITNNANVNNFAYWMDIDDLKTLANHNYGYEILDIVWSSAPENVCKAIDGANELSFAFPPRKRFSPSVWGYILAAKDSSKFAIYADVVMKKLLDINSPAKTKGLTQGEKYDLLNNSANYLGELIQKDNPNNEAYFSTALNGQDFLWITIADY